MDELLLELIEELVVELEEITDELLLALIDEDEKLVQAELFCDDSLADEEFSGLALLDEIISPGDALPAELLKAASELLMLAAELLLIDSLLTPAAELLLVVVCKLLMYVELLTLAIRLDDDLGVGFCAALLIAGFMLPLLGGEL